MLRGASDQLIDPAYGPEFERRIPGAELRVIPEAGHMLPIEQPDAVRDAIVSLL